MFDLTPGMADDRIELFAVGIDLTDEPYGLATERIIQLINESIARLDPADRKERTVLTAAISDDDQQLEFTTEEEGLRVRWAGKPLCFISWSLFTDESLLFDEPVIIDPEEEA
ncbi:hypothetical protein ABZS66_37365 [Dactylosporangium sp. NPDC005572]|uniref:hypothetical protein n=1 Tax=Dactylosporangium sp. NPDC005572 TaxID=3156889 RepID=UPI0033B6CEB1